MNTTVNKNQQTANFQGLMLHGKIDTKQIGSHNGQRVEAGPPQAKGPGFFGKVWIAVKNFFGGGGAKTVTAATAPPPRSSAPQTALDVRAAVPAARVLMRPYSQDQIRHQVMVAIGHSGREKFNAAANMKTDTEGYVSPHWQKDVVDKNPVMKHVLDGFVTLQRQSTNKEWLALSANGNAGFVAKAIELAKEFHNQTA